MRIRGFILSQVCVDSNHKPASAADISPNPLPFFHNHFGTFILAPPHPKQKKKLISQWQHLLLKARPKIETMFDYLKEHLYLVSSFPRSIMGYLFHYLRVLLAYQMKGLF